MISHYVIYKIFKNCINIFIKFIVSLYEKKGDKVGI